MSDPFERLERELRRGMRRVAGSQPAAGGARRLRVPALAAVLLLASTTIALAASGVILTGTPVRPEEAPNPGVGEGVPAPGGSRLLALRASDPAGGLPWGMRMVRTTRGELCVQIGRVEGGQLGVLGIDGAFKDDGRFHPLPTNALPRDVYHGHPFDEAGNATTSCQLAGQAIVGEHIGVDRSGAANARVSTVPLVQLRDIYYGILGAQAVSVTYNAGHKSTTQPLLAPVGAYLIVTPTSPVQQTGSGGASLGTEGQLTPSAPLSRITYRLDGKLCEREPSLAPWQKPHVADPCPQPSYPTGRRRTRDLHRPLNVRLQINHDLVVGAQLSFVAPYAVTSASEDYTIRLPTVLCHQSATGEQGGSIESLDRNVKAGTTVSLRLPDPFAADCAQRVATVEVLYGPTFGAKLLVGSVTLHRPSTTRPTPLPPIPRRLAVRRTGSGRAARLTRRPTAPGR